MNEKNFFLGLLIGGSVGFISTLLSVPSSGKETRKVIKENAGLLMDRLVEVKENLQDLSHTVKGASVDSSETIKNFIFEAKKAVSNWRKEIEPHQRDLKKELEAIEKSIQAIEDQFKTTS